MKRTIISLVAFFVMTSTIALAQENKPPDQTPTTPTTTEPEKPKNEVDRMLEGAAKRGETIIGTCVTEECAKNSTEVAAGLETGGILQIPKPAYPKLARMARAQGTVDVKVIIGEDGKVIAAAAISGHPLLYAASVAAARDAVFSPTRLHGKPVKVSGVIKYNFVAPSGF